MIAGVNHISQIENTITLHCAKCSNTSTTGAGAGFFARSVLKTGIGRVGKDEQRHLELNLNLNLNLNLACDQ